MMLQLQLVCGMELRQSINACLGVFTFESAEGSIALIDEAEGKRLVVQLSL